MITATVGDRIINICKFGPIVLKGSVTERMRLGFVIMHRNINVGQ